MVVDDEVSITDGLRLLFGAEGYAVEPRGDLSGALAALERKSFDLVITDLSLGGLELLKNAKAKHPETEVIIITGYGSIAQAVEATKAGAYYFIEKPFEPEQILLIAEKALERRRLVAESAKLREHFTQREQFYDLIGSSKAMQTIYETIEHVAKTDANVLIIGDSGTGKELIANAIHFNSHRASRDFVKVNCSALPKELIESELFGYVKGAFTGAAQDRIGLFAQADKGSLLLDELAEMPIDLQPKLLRVLEERRYRRVGDSVSRDVDFRLICSTNRSPHDAIKKGLLREDLYYRISTITIIVPPLRERSEDLQILIDEFYRRFCERYERSLKGVSQAAYQRLFAHNWPGNVRELQNVMERAVLLSKGPYIEAEDLPLGTSASNGNSSAFYFPPHMKWSDLERAVITTALERAKGNKRAAAAALGMQRSRLYNKLSKYKINVTRQRKH
ncbi:MAG: sigma-54-dependent Fis family transcriptional regulator [Acidobacteria bacterium]|nr:sigma-54-dependent Fis family transcriptional regulator [Acidobacteriota bacterium]